MNQERFEQIISLRHELHAHPELSMQERRTKEILMDFIRAHSKLQVVDRGRWFYALYRCRQPQKEAVALRADFDALAIGEEWELPYRSQNPGVSHRCGHDGHSAALAGAALEIDELGAKRDVYFVFQHAEEIGGGGAQCAGLIREKGIGKVFAFHNMSGYPLGSVMVCDGAAQCASKGLTVHFTGSPAHASQPQDGKNPAGALARLALYAEEAAAAGKYRGMVMATIVQLTAGHKNFGIAASEGELSMTLRADYEQDMEVLERQVRQKALALAAENGLQVSFSESDVFPQTVNSPDCAALVRRAAAENGFPVIPMKEPFRASEDFGYYLKECPGAIFYIGNGEDYAQLHTSGYDFNDRILQTAVEQFKKIIELA